MKSIKILKSLEVNRNEKLINCIEIINKTHKEFVYVVNKKKQLIGILTDADVRRAILKKKNLEDSIEKVYNKNPVFAYQNYSLEKLFKIFNKYKVKFIPILNKKKNIVDFIEIHEMQELIKSKRDFAYIDETPKSIIIMAGGKGLRLGSLTKNMPKPLIKIEDKKSLLEYNIDHFLNQGAEKIYVLTHFLSHKIEIKIKQNKFYRNKVFVVKEKKEMGTIGGINLLKKKLTNFPVIVINSDIVSDLNLKSFFNFHKINKNDLTIALKQVFNRSSFGEVEVKNYKIKNIDEKKIKTTFINAGIYCLNSKIFDMLALNKKTNMDYIISEAIDKKYRVGGYPMLEFWMDIGNKTNLEVIRNILKKRR